jgi:hypothetical protein
MAVRAILCRYLLLFLLYLPFFPTAASAEMHQIPVLEPFLLFYLIVIPALTATESLSVLPDPSVAIPTL